MGIVARVRYVNGKPRFVNVRRRRLLQRLQRRAALWLRVNVRGAARRVVAHRGNERVPCGQPVVRMGGAVRDYPALTPHTCPVVGARKAGAS